MKPMCTVKGPARVFESRFGRAAVIVVVGFGVACDHGVMTPPDRPVAGLTISGANPADGNGTLDPGTTAVQYYKNVGVQDLDKVTFSGRDTTGAIEHQIEVMWVPGTGQVMLCQHFWTPTGGATSGWTRCASGTANACSPQTISIDPVASTIRLNGVLLQDVSGGDATSTVTGTIAWAGDPIYDDH